ncbi:MAG: hypothetical protein MPJ78_00255 [Hyphomicrobiaceae bacterium]|nr:hypothetical protein [Hyphomicrobiaceae bacterium]
MVLRTGIAGVSLAVALLLVACGGGGASRSGPSAGMASNTGAPVQLGGARAPAGGASNSVIGPLNDELARHAVENYRISKNRAPGRYQMVGADLNGDGVREAMVLFQGKDWCTRTGCSMAIFQTFDHGFRPISRTVRVKPPIEIADTVTNGYRDLLVQTGGGPAPERRVRLRFTGEHYSRNAMLEQEVPLGSVVRTEIAIQSTVPQPGAAANRAAPR